MNKKLLFLIAFISLGSGLIAQNLQWAHQIAGLSYSGARNNTTLDNAGNIYTTGKFSGTFDFDPGPATFYLTSAGNGDIFITKSDPSGNFIWAIKIGGSSDDGGNSIAVDGWGNLYVSGKFGGTVDFNPDTGSYWLSSFPSSLGSFVLKLDSSKNFIWARGPFTGTGYGYGNSLTIDAAGCTYLFTGQNDVRAYLVKISPSGSIIKTNTIYWSSYILDVTNSISITHDNSANIYLTGNFYPSNNWHWYFVKKLDSAGNSLWTYMDTGSVYVNSIVSDASGNAYITGYFSGTVKFGTGYNLSSNGSNDIFIAKLSSTGNLAWAKAIGGTGDDDGFGIALDDSGSIYTTGLFNGTVDFDPGAGVYNLTSTGGSDIFISKQNFLGNFVWSKKFGSSSNDFGTSVNIDLSKNIYVTGSFLGTIDFDPGPGTYYLSPVNSNAFLFKMGSCGIMLTTQPNYATVNIGNNAQFIVNTNSNTASYQWQQNSGSGFVNLSNAGLYSGTNTSFLTISNVPYSKNNYAFRCIVTEGACTVTSSTALLFVNCNFSISAQPVNKNANTGTSVQIAVGVTATSANFQWQQNSGSGFVNLINSGIYTGVNTAILTINPVNYSLHNYKYRCLVSDGICNFITDTSRLTINCVFSISRQPLSQSGNAGSDARFTVLATGTTLSYQWQQKSGTAFVDLTDSGQFMGTNDDTLLISKVTLNQNNKYFRCNVKDAGCPLTSDSAKLTVSCTSTIYLQPVNQSVNVDDNAQFIVKSSGLTTSFQWQQNSGSGFVNLTNSTQFSGVTKDTLHINKVTLLQNNFAYRCILLYAGCRDTSNIAILSVHCTLAINAQPVNQTVIVDSNARFIISASSPTTIYQWQFNSGSGFVNLTNSGTYSGVTDDTLTISNISFSQNNYSYRCIVTDKGCIVISNQVLLKVDCHFSIIQQPVNQSVFINSDAKFIVKTSIPALRFQWQEDQGTGFVNLSNNSNFSGVNKDTLWVINVSTSQNNINYRCLVIDSGCQISSNSAKLTVTCPFNITYQPANQTAIVGSNTKFIVGSSDPTVNFQWQQNTGLGFTNLINDITYSGVTNDTLIITNVNFVQNNYLYRCILSSWNCQLISDEAKLTVNCNFNLVEQPQSQTANVGSSTKFIIVSSDPTVNFQWQQNAGFGYTNLINDNSYSGVTNDTLSITNINFYHNNYLYRCILSAGNCQIISNEAKLTANCNLNILVQPQNQTSFVLSKAQFSIVVSNSEAYFQWQQNSGSGFVNFSNTFQYEGVNNDTLILSNIYISQNNRQYRCYVYYRDCSTYSDSAILTVLPTGLESYGFQKGFMIYPVPFDEQLTIEINMNYKDLEYMISDALGKVLLNGKINDKVTSINMRLLSPGLYFIRVGSDTRKLLKR